MRLTCEEITPSLSTKVLLTKQLWQQGNNFREIKWNERQSAMSNGLSSA